MKLAAFTAIFLENGDVKDSSITSLEIDPRSSEISKMAAEAEKKDLPPLVETPIIDRAHLSTMTGGDAELACEIIEIFRHQSEIWARMLDPDSPAQHWADASHSLKGAALSVGAKQLAASCAVAETLGRRENAPTRTEAAVALAEVKNELGHALEAAARLSYDIERKGEI